MTLLERLLGREPSASGARSVPVGRDVDLIGNLFSKALTPDKAASYVKTSNHVYACSRVRSSLVSSVPLRLYDTARKEILEHPIRQLLDHVNPHFTFTRLMYATEMALCTWGSAYWVVEKDARGVPKELWWVKPTQMAPVPDEEKYLKGFIFQTASGKTIPFKPDEVIWFRYFNPDDEYSGLPPLAAAKLAADVSQAAMISNRNLFAQGMQLAGFVMPKGGVPLTNEQMAELETAIQRRFSGLDKAHRWGVFKAEFDIKQLGVTPKDAEWLGAMNYALQDTARAYGVPDELVGGGKRTYQNISEALTSIWTLTCSPELRFIDSEINEQLLPMFGTRAKGLRAAFDLSGIGALQTEQEATWRRVTHAFAVGLLGERKGHELLGIEYNEDDRRLLTAVQQMVPLAGSKPDDAADAEDTLS